MQYSSSTNIYSFVVNWANGDFFVSFRSGFYSAKTQWLLKIKVEISRFCQLSFILVLNYKFLSQVMLSAF